MWNPQDLLTRHKELVSRFTLQHYDQVHEPSCTHFADCSRACISPALCCQTCALMHKRRNAHSVVAAIGEMISVHAPAAVVPVSRARRGGEGVHGVAEVGQLCHAAAVAQGAPPADAAASVAACAAHVWAVPGGNTFPAPAELVLPLLRGIHCAVQLLGEILLDPTNAKTMMRYVTDAENLKLMMVLLKETSKSIQFEAFHVFKVR